jgi:hypothetical protein
MNIREARLSHKSWDLKNDLAEMAERFGLDDERQLELVLRASSIISDDFDIDGRGVAQYLDIYFEQARETGHLPSYRGSHSIRLSGGVLSMSREDAICLLTVNAADRFDPYEGREIQEHVRRELKNFPFEWWKGADTYGFICEIVDNFDDPIRTLEQAIKQARKEQIIFDAV